MRVIKEKSCGATGKYEVKCDSKYLNVSLKLEFSYKNIFTDFFERVIPEITTLPILRLFKYEWYPLFEKNEIASKTSKTIVFQ